MFEPGAFEVLHLNAILNEGLGERVAEDLEAAVRFPVLGEWTADVVKGLDEVEAARRDQGLWQAGSASSTASRRHGGGAAPRWPIGKATPTRAGIAWTVANMLSSGKSSSHVERARWLLECCQRCDSVAVRER